jgi:hypothetical protein
MTHSGFRGLQNFLMEICPIRQKAVCLRRCVLLRYRRAVFGRCRQMVFAGDGARVEALKSDELFLAPLVKASSPRHDSWPTKVLSRRYCC